MTRYSVISLSSITVFGNVVCILGVLFTSFSVVGTLNAVCEQGAVCCWVFIHKQYPWITRDEKTMMLSVYVCKPSIYIVLPYSYIRCLRDNLKPAQSLHLFRWRTQLLYVFCRYFVPTVKWKISFLRKLRIFFVFLTLFKDGIFLIIFIF